MIQIHSHHPVRILAITVLSFLLTTVATQAMTTEEINRTLEAESGGTLIIKVDSGQIDVSGKSTSTVEIEISRSIGDSSKEKEADYLAKHPVTIEQEGNQITITQKGGKRSTSGWWFNRGPKIKARYTISVPDKFNVDLETSGGAINARNLTGNVAVNTSGGSIALAYLHGPTNAHTSGGSITAESGSGDLKLHTSGGSLTVIAHDGNINGHTSGGSIRATLLSRPSSDCSLSTSGGSIRVKLPPDTAVTLDASTSGGSVSSDFDVPGRDPKKKNRLSGPINGGGPALHLRTSGGNIRINRESGA
ncbi:MAG: hypothetical protein DRP71_15540 [Verrucomicrobia bacterium]|nr:MAG: hypothetical protein DRP71_15540 [Verrucomicrobiota bacterium]